MNFTGNKRIPMEFWWVLSSSPKYSVDMEHEICHIYFPSECAFLRQYLPWLNCSSINQNRYLHLENVNKFPSQRINYFSIKIAMHNVSLLCHLMKWFHSIYSIFYAVQKKKTKQKKHSSDESNTFCSTNSMHKFAIATSFIICSCQT